MKRKARKAALRRKFSIIWKSKYYHRVNCPYCGKPFYAPKFGKSMNNRSGWSNTPRSTARCPECGGEFVMKEGLDEK
jgi:DNA-directed RNA polymerase subunit RPC12/RpoP